MSEHKKERLLTAIEHAAAEFINRESNRKSLITVTRATFRENEKTVNVFISVIPDTEMGAAIDFLSRQRDSFLEFLRRKIRTRTLPHVYFLADPYGAGVDPVIDYGNTKKEV